MNKNAQLTLTTIRHLHLNNFLRYFEGITVHFGFCWVNDSTICFQNEIRDARSKLGHVDKKGWRKGAK